MKRTALSMLTRTFSLYLVISSLHLFVDSKEFGFGETESRSSTDAVWKRLLPGDDVEAVDVNLPFRRLSSCTQRCQSVALHASCLARCLFSTTRSADHLPARSPRRSTAFVPRSTACRTDQGDQTGHPCVSVGRPITDVGPPHDVVQDWTDASPGVSDFETRSTSKRVYNDPVGLCIAYNCPNAVPASLAYMRCVRQYHCM